MKKIFVFILTLLIFLIILVYAYVTSLKREQSIIKQFNMDYEVYLDKQIIGAEVTSLINKIINNNEKNKVSKDENGFYIENDKNSILMQIKITDNDTIYRIESFYNSGMVDFIKYYDSISFECKQIKYNSLGKVNYLLFEQITN